MENNLNETTNEEIVPSALLEHLESFVENQKEVVITIKKYYDNELELPTVSTSVSEQKIN